MPLIHSKKPAAFKENIRKEVHAGKPVKQAVAIAYSEKRRAEHRKHAHGGEIEDCPTCMADGGEVGINKQAGGEREGVSEAGEHVRRAAREKDRPSQPRVTGLWPGDDHEVSREEDEKESARNIHHENLYELKHMKKPNIKGLAEGGSVRSGKTRQTNEKGVHSESFSYDKPGTSDSGVYIRSHGSTSDKSKKLLRAEHEDIMSQQSKINPKLEGLAHGGVAGEMHLRDSGITKTKADRIHKYDDGGEVNTGADDPDSWAYKVQHAFDPEGGTQHDISDQKFLQTDNEYSGGEVEPAGSDVEDPDNEDPTQADLRIKTDMDTYAEGGEVGEDSELDDMMSGELMDAIHSKDKKGIMRSIEAIVLSMRNKGG